jgi:hypothetical protein
MYCTRDVLLSRGARHRLGAASPSSAMQGPARTVVFDSPAGPRVALQRNTPPKGDPAAAHAARAPVPPLPSGGGSSPWPQKIWERADRAGDGPP